MPVCEPQSSCSPPRRRRSRRSWAWSFGADDYVTKPFGTRELRVRVKALLRRSAAAHLDCCRFGDVEIDFGRGEVRAAGKSVDLTPIEFRLLSVLIRAGGRVLNRQQLLDAAWGRGAFAPRASSTTTSPTCAARSSRIRPARATCAMCAASATASTPKT